MMKNVSKLLTVCVIIGFVGLYALEQRADDTKNAGAPVTDQQHNSAKYTGPIKSGKENKADIAMDALLEDNEGNDIALALLQRGDGIEKGTSAVHAVYDEIIDGYGERKAKKVYIDALLPQDAGKERIFVFSAVDAETNEVIAGASVYLWGAFVGYTTDDGTLTVTKNIPKSHELLSFEVYKRGYSRGFQTFNGVQFKGTENRFNFKLNTSMAHTVKTTTENFDIQEEKFALKLEDTCSLLDASGDCYEGEVEVEYTYVAPGEINNASIPMQAFYNGEVVHLTSNGMAFTDFFNAQGEPLEYNQKNGEVCYTLEKEQIDMWKDKVQAGSSNGYRWFNRAAGYREKDETATISISEDQFCATSTKIY